MKKILFIIGFICIVIYKLEASQNMSCSSLEKRNALIKSQFECDYYIISILHDINLLNGEYLLGDASDKNDVGEVARTKLKMLVDSFGDPVELARLMIICRYLSLTMGYSYDNPYSGISEGLGFQRLRELRFHENFIKSLQYIYVYMRLDTATGLMFRELIADTINVPGVSEAFSSYIKQKGIKPDEL